MTADPRAEPAVVHHPAVDAWRRLGTEGAAAPVAVETLQKRRKGRVYRLRGAAPGGGDVIAKWSTGERVGREALAYEVLPSLPVTSPRHYGTLATDDGWWLFIAHAGGEDYSHELREHRALAGHWLAVLHTSAAEVTRASSLPDRGPDFYRGELECGRADLLAHLANPALTSDDVALLEEVVAQCELLAKRWSELERTCGLTPPTFIHGDFAPKNMHVERAPGTASLQPFDWASAGWGTPAPDLPQLDATPSTYWASPDLEVYRSGVERNWPRPSRQDVFDLSVVGKVLRTLHCIRLEAPGLATDWPEAGMRDMRYYHADLRDALVRTGWCP